MVGLLGGLVGFVGTNVCVVTCGCDVGFNWDCLAMAICVICWLSWYICVHS